MERLTEEQLEVLEIGLAGAGHGLDEQLMNALDELLELRRDKARLIETVTDTIAMQGPWGHQALAALVEEMEGE